MANFQEITITTKTVYLLAINKSVFLNFNMSYFSVFGVFGRKNTIGFELPRKKQKLATNFCDFFN